MSPYENLRRELKSAPHRWLITGVAGFIGSNLLEQLLTLGQTVVGLDNFSTGKEHNLEEVKARVTPEQWAGFRFIEGDITHLETCTQACTKIDFVLHQAGRGSVPRSLANPIATHDVNVTGFLNMLVAARDAGVKRFVYASSSSVYGDHPALPKVEDRVGTVLSPYAATKAMDEMYASVFSRAYRMPNIGLRYFNVFGPRQDPDGPYAAVIPLWIASLLKGAPVYINGDGETSRDFCYVANVVQANLLAACSDASATNQVYNIAVGQRTTLNELYHLIRAVVPNHNGSPEQTPAYRPFRPGDVRHSLADITKAKQMLGYTPTHTVEKGLHESMTWYCSREEVEHSTLNIQRSTSNIES